MSRNFRNTVMIVAVVLGAAPLHAQEQRPSEPPVEAREVRSRSSSQVVLMQHALDLAVRRGASDLLNQLSRITRMPPFGQLDGQPQVHGFELPDYGLFFHVRVPDMSATVLNALPYLMNLQRSTMTVRSPEGRALVVPAGIGDPQAAAERAAPPVSPLDMPQISAADLAVLKDPDPHYVQAIRAALIDSMLEDSRALRLRPGEFLTVAVRKDVVDPLDPDVRQRTMYFRVPGNVLTEYHQDHITLEEARRQVTVTTD